MKRKKVYDEQLKKLDGTLMILEGQCDMLESANTNAEVFSVLTSASKSLKAANNNL